MNTTHCRYCHELTSTDPYSEDFQHGYHWSCLWESPTGEWEVVTTQHATTPARVSVRRYQSRARAVEVARETRRHNQRDWPCGAQLDIVVRFADLTAHTA